MAAAILRGDPDALLTQPKAVLPRLLVTSRMLAFRDQTETRQEFLSAIDLMRSGKLSA